MLNWQREIALLELSKKRESFPDLAPVLWHSFGTISALLQEILSVYPMLSPPTLSPPASNRVCNALALLQCVASHPETKTRLVNGAYILIFLEIISGNLIIVLLHDALSSNSPVFISIP